MSVTLPHFIIGCNKVVSPKSGFISDTGWVFINSCQYLQQHRPELFGLYHPNFGVMRVDLSCYWDRSYIDNRSSPEQWYRRDNIM